MSDMVRGMVVYHRDSLKRGLVTASNQFTAMLAVAFDDGTRELLHVSKLMSEQRYNELQEETTLKAIALKEEARIKAMALKAEQVLIGAVVYWQSKTPPLRRGKIAGPLVGSMVIVEWDDGAISKHEIRFLLSELDGTIEDKRLSDEKDRLEREFDEAKDLIAEKLDAAAKLINEAASIAEDKDVSIMDMYDETRELERAMGNAGWSTSSWHC